MPAAASNRTVLVRRLLVVGSFPELQAKAAALAQAADGRRLTLAQIEQYAADLQQTYAVAGFALVQVTVPDQTFKNGVVRLVVEDRFIEDLDLSSVSERSRALVRVRLQPLVGRRRLMQKELERRVLLLGDIAGLIGSTSTRSGLQPGGLVLIVQAKENLVSVATGIDNRLPGSLGRTQLQSTFAYNNALGFGEQIHAEGASGTNLNHVFDGQAQLQSFGGGISVPVGYDGLTLAAAFSSVRSNPTIQPGTFTVPGETETATFDRTTARATFPLLLTVQTQLRVQAGYEHIDDQVHVGLWPAFATATGPIFHLSDDRYDDVRIAGEFATQAVPFDGRFSGALFFSHGIDGRTASTTLPLSQPGASPIFSKLRLVARYDQPLPGELNFSLFARAQTSFGGSLPLPEQLSLDGVEALSGFSDGTVSVDSGAVGRAELSRTFVTGGGGTITSLAPYAFVGAGGGEHYQPFFSQAKYVRAESVGGGLRAATNFFGPEFQESASIEAAKNFANVALSTIPYSDGDYRVSFSYVMRYAGTPSLSHSVVELADVPVQAPRPVSRWAGFYAGLNAGYGLSAGDNVTNTAVPTVNTLDLTLGSNYAGASAASAATTTSIFSNGFIGGGQLGYNLPAGDRFVLGAEADFQGSGIVGRGASTGQGIVSDGVSTATITTTTQNEKQLNWLGTARARIGYLATPNLLLYGTGGLAFGDVTSSNQTFQSASGLLAAPTLQFIDSSGSRTQLASGYAAGAGFEWMFSPSVSFKAEYLYYDLGIRTANTGPLVQTNFTGLIDAENSASQTRFDGHIVRVGLNYHFNGDTGRDINGVRELADPSAEVADTLPTVATRWTGAYIGLNAGYAFDTRPGVANAAVVNGTALDQGFAGATIGPAAAQSASVHTSTTADGFVGGGTVGYNRAFDRIVVGAEADLGGAGASGKGSAFGTAVANVGGTANPVASLVNNEKSIDWLSTVRGRLGYLITPRLLAFGTGGLAVGGVSQQTSAFQLFGGPAGSFLASSGSFGRGSAVLVGYSIGGGLEWMLTPALGVKAEYLHFDLGSTATPGGTLTTAFGFSDTASLASRSSYGGEIVRAGLNYHFAQ